MTTSIDKGMEQVDKHIQVCAQDGVWFRNKSKELLIQQ